MSPLTRQSRLAHALLLSGALAAAGCRSVGAGHPGALGAIGPRGAIPPVGMASESAGDPAWRSPPRPLPPRAVRGRLRDTVHAILDAAVRDGAFPGAYLVVGSSRDVLVQRGVGVLDAADRRRPTDRTLWDLASLTKVIATTTAVLQLVGEGRIALDSPAVRYLPAWSGGNDAVTVRHLLTHSAGLPAGRPYFRTAATREEAVAQLLATPPDSAPGARYLYSDIGFLLLGQLVEAVRRQPLDQVVADGLVRPLGLRETRYAPPPAWRHRTAPTEVDAWRGRQLRGEVHDENAYRLEGVAGHAGLFASARDLTRVAQLYLRGGRWRNVQLLDQATMQEFTRLQAPLRSHRALGWETPSGGNSAGRWLSPRAFGHTGFTGTSLWIDPDRDLFILLLTNRVNPTRANLRISRVRTALADAIVTVLDPPAPVVGGTAERP
jgi:CubicO group peptidase (beta-lactamase class C family)